MRLVHDDFADELVSRRRQDRVKLIATSPAKNASKNSVPVLIGQGSVDARVVKHAEAMVGELERNGVPANVFIYEDEIRGFMDDRNAIHFYKHLAAFFAHRLSRR